MLPYLAWFAHSLSRSKNRAVVVFLSSGSREQKKVTNARDARKLRAAPPLAPPGAADAPTLDFYVERRTTITTTFGTATEAQTVLARATRATPSRAASSSRRAGEAFEFFVLQHSRDVVWMAKSSKSADADRLAAEIGGYLVEEFERRRKKRPGTEGRAPFLGT